MGNLDVGHGGTYWEPDGGAFGVAAANWLSWTLKGDLTAAEWFTGSGATEAGWATESDGLENLLSFSR